MARQNVALRGRCGYISIMFRKQKPMLKVGLHCGDYTLSPTSAVVFSLSPTICFDKINMEMLYVACHLSYDGSYSRAGFGRPTGL